MDEIEDQLASTEQEKISSLRSVKELIQKKNAIDQEITLLEHKIDDISRMVGVLMTRQSFQFTFEAKEMIKKRHYDSAAIKRSIEGLVDRFNALQVF